MIYHIKSDTKEYISTSLLERDPIDNLPLIPAHATEIVPPDIGVNEVAIFINNNWEIVADYREQTYYDPITGEEIKMVLGDLPIGLADSPKPNEYNTWNGSSWVEDTVTKTQAELDFQVNHLDNLIAKSFVKLVKILLQKNIIQVSDLPQDLVDAYQARMALRND